MLPTGLFVGPHVLLAAGVHVALGMAFAIAAYGIRRGNSRGLACAVLCAVVTLMIGLIAVGQCVTDHEFVGLWFWIPFSFYFLCLAALAARLAFARSLT